MGNMMLRTWLKAARVAADMSHRDLAEKLGVSHVAVIGWESGTRRPTYEKMLSLSKVFPDVEVMAMFASECDETQSETSDQGVA